MDSALTYTDTTDQDGTYTYAVATIRQDNGETSVSGPGASVQVTTDSTVPPAPENLVLELVPQGIQLNWNEASGTEPVTYSIYRTDQTSLTTVTGLYPLVTGIGQTMVIDPTPSPTEHCYAITAVDAAGNESLPSNSYYLNFDLLPVSTLTVTQQESDPPTIAWSHADTSGKIAGYYAYLGKDRQGFRFNLALMTDESFVDYGYTGRDRSYIFRFAGGDQKVIAVGY